MGLTKRNDVWWMSFMYQGRQVRRSTGTSKKQLAEAIYAKVKVQIAEGQFFERREEQEHTFKEMMERYVTERATLKAVKSRLRDHAALGHLLPVLGEKVLAHITPKVMARPMAARLAARVTRLASWPLRSPRSTSRAVSARVGSTARTPPSRRLSGRLPT